MAKEQFSQRKLEELMKLRDEIGLHRIEERRLKTEILMINSSRFYRLFRTTIDAVSKREKPANVLRQYRSILRREEMIDIKRKPGVEVYPTAVHTRQQIVEAVRAGAKRWQAGQGDPLVSVIVLTHNGVKDLKRLLGSFQSAGFYPNYEIIVVDNASADGTREYLEQQKKFFRLRVLYNEENVSFSRGCNQGAETAAGEYLLFLNNDVEVLDGWMDEMLRAAFAHPDAGAVGARLIYPRISEQSVNRGRSFLVQHAGITFSREMIPDFGWFYKPVNIQGEDALKEPLAESRPAAAVTAACMLMKKSVFLEIGGFDEAYRYGYEDVDICLKACRNGYVNYYCPSAVAFHYEFGTQSKNQAKDVSERRRSNREYFDKRWKRWLEKKYIGDKAQGGGLFFDGILTVAFAVTEKGENAVAGDYFTALELGEALQAEGIRVKYLSMAEGDWYNVGLDTDIVVSMLQHYDPMKIYNAPEHLITVGWARNWFDKWVEAPFISDYSILLASSETARKYMEERLNRKVWLLPIATNPERFGGVGKETEAGPEEADYTCDYCFTGNRFSREREIEQELNPEELPFRFHLYGDGWEQSETLGRYSMGHLKYQDMEKAYRHTKVVLDDATPSTKKAGAINSRVYDALMSGCLVLTNNVRGAEETFEGKLPVFYDAASLKEQLAKYLADDELRKRTVEGLQLFVRQRHTYAVRAKEMKRILSDALWQKRNRAAILICAPVWQKSLQWGDYYFAESLAKSLENRGMRTEIHVRAEWYDVRGADLTIFLRGTVPYVPGADSVNVIWNISHPDDVTKTELKAFDRVYIASSKTAEEWKNAGIRAACLPQCTDPEVFTADDLQPRSEQLLFVGNTRGVFRQIIHDLIPTDYRLAIYGNGWEEFLGENPAIRGSFIANDELAKTYRSACILLNDHWTDMKEKGFLSNRIYDALAAGTFVISDEVESMDAELREGIETYRTREDLREKIRYYLEHPEKRREKVDKGRAVVLEKHTFERRADRILSDLQKKETGKT